MTTTTYTDDIDECFGYDDLLRNDPLFYDLRSYCRFPNPDSDTARAVWGPDCQFPHMHYSDRYWDKGRTLYGSKRPGLQYDYSDRLQSWDYTMYDVGAHCARKRTFSANWWKAHLEAYTLHAVTIVHVIGGCNRATGYEYYAIGYTLGEPLPAERVNHIRHVAGRLRYKGRMGTRLPAKLQADVTAVKVTE